MSLPAHEAEKKLVELFGAISASFVAAVVAMAVVLFLFSSGPAGLRRGSVAKPRCHRKLLFKDGSRGAMRYVLSAHV